MIYISPGFGCSDMAQKKPRKKGLQRTNNYVVDNQNKTQKGQVKDKRGTTRGKNDRLVSKIFMLNS